MTSSAGPPEIAEHADWIDCYACGGSFALGVSAEGSPLALHTEEHCAAFDAIEDSIDAVRHAQRCRAALMPS